MPKIGLDDEAEREIADLLAHLGPIADRLGSRAAVAQYEADIADPAATRAGTSLAASVDPLPRFLPMRDVVRISFNIQALVPAETILRRLLRSPRLPTDDNLTNCLPYAPDLGAAIDLAVRHASSMLPWFDFRHEICGEEIHIICRPTAPLGRIAALSTELAMTSAHRIVETIVGPDIAAARIHFAQPPVSGAAALRERFCCAVSVGAGETHMAIPLAWRDRASPYRDALAWQEGVARCEADMRLVRDPPLITRVRAQVRLALDERRALTLAESAQALGIATRSLVRGLAKDGTTHHRIVDDERKWRARQLLAQSTMPIGEIAEALGFSDQSSFGRNCRSWFDFSPTHLRQQLTTAPGNN